MFITPLSPQNIAAATELANNLFPADQDDGDPPLASFQASLDPEKFRDYWIKFQDKKIDCYVAQESVAGPLIGITGLYQGKNDPADVAWLGWFGVDSAYRGRGLGKKLLLWTMAQARSEGYKKLRLYTSTYPAEAAAQILYEKLGFSITGQEIKPGDIYTTIYREATL